MPFPAESPVKRRVSKQAQSTRDRREQILDSAVEAFTSRGFNGTSMRDIATRAEISHTGLLHHFPEKAGILEAVLDRRVERANQDVKLDRRDGLEFLRGLVALTERDVTRAAELGMYCVVAAEALAPSHPAHEYFVRWYRTVREAIHNALKDLDQRGLYAQPSVSLDVASAHIAGMRDGLNQQWLLAPEEIDLPATARAQLQFYVSVSL